MEPKQHIFVISTILPVFSAAIPKRTVPSAPEKMTIEHVRPAISSLYPTLYKTEKNYYLSTINLSTFSIWTFMDSVEVNHMLMLKNSMEENNFYYSSLEEIFIH